MSKLIIAAFLTADSLHRPLAPSPSSSIIPVRLVRLAGKFGRLS